MGVYRQLLLEAGGGIISPAQQAEQNDRETHVVIGLGGLGIESLRQIKARVHQDIKPNNPEGGGSEYSNIRFLGIDSDTGSLKVGAWKSEPRDWVQLSQDEVFYIGSDALKTQIGGGALSLRAMKEFKWLSPALEPSLLGSCGSGGERQVGRALLMNKSQELYERLENMLTPLCEEAWNVNVHVVTGLGGGTGSGIFLDVLYMLRDVAPNAVLFGYFYLPDVITSGELHPLSKRYIDANTYAALQELNFCMGMPENDCGFTQPISGGHDIPWKRRPVDFPFLVGAAHTDGAVAVNSRREAIDSVAAFIESFMIKTDEGWSDPRAALSNAGQWIYQAEAEQTSRSNPAYFTIGAAEATVPVREIATYLGSSLLERCASLPQWQGVGGKTGEALANLLETVQANVAYLKQEPQGSGVRASIVALDDLRPLLGEELSRVAGDTALQSLVEQLEELNLDAIGSAADRERAVVGAFTGWVTDEMFPSVLNASLDQYIAQQHGTDNPEMLAEYAAATVKATADRACNVRFNADPQLETVRGELILRIPDSYPVRHGSERIKDADDGRFGVVSSVPGFRGISAICLSGPFPLFAYREQAVLRDDYFLHASPGIHLYEDGDERLDMPFGDWRTLPPLEPQSLLDLETMPVEVAAAIDEKCSLSASRSLYDEALRWGALQRSENGLGVPEQGNVDFAEAAIGVANRALEKALKGAPERLAVRISRVEAIAKAAEAALVLQPEELPISTLGNQEAQDVLAKDRFVASPWLHGRVRAMIAAKTDIGAQLGDLYYELRKAKRTAGIKDQP